MNRNSYITNFTRPIFPEIGQIWQHKNAAKDRGLILLNAPYDQLQPHNFGFRCLFVAHPGDFNFSHWESFFEMHKFVEVATEEKIKFIRDRYQKWHEEGNSVSLAL